MENHKEMTVLGAFWVQAFLGVIYYWLRLTAITDRGDRLRTCDLVLPKLPQD